MKTLTKSKINIFKKMFLERQQAIMNTNTLRGGEIDVTGGDEIDVVQGVMLKSMLDKLSLRDKDSLSKIKNALQKIEEGTFGLCEECEELIPEKRLSALPDCSFCITCAEQEERRQKQYRS